MKNVWLTKRQEAHVKGVSMPSKKKKRSKKISNDDPMAWGN